jgi:synaptic vesicle membrane protein VAT-1
MVKILGQDADVLVAVFANLLSWFVATWFPSWLPKLLPTIVEQDCGPAPDPNQTRCIAIGRPGGKEQLRLIRLKPDFVTCGYNVPNGSPFIKVIPARSTASSSQAQVDPAASTASAPSATPAVVVRVHSFSINYADCCIRWGLYESANKFVGYPIVPGFDIAGVVEQVLDGGDSSSSSPFQVGDKVYGATFFGAYSTRVLTPCSQLRRIPSGLSMAQAASLPAVSLTALYALVLAGHFVPSSTSLLPTTTSSRTSSTSQPKNRAILIHSAAGGVGSMLIQMSKLLGLSPIIGVVGRSSKVDAAKALGCDVVIDKSHENLWQVASKAVPNGYSAICDANGVSTLSESYRHLAPTGRLVVFGFHSNLPMGQDMLSPMEWLKMVVRMVQLPKFDAMDLVTSNKGVLGFNLSFFVDEMDLLGQLYDQIGTWISNGQLVCPRIVEMDLGDITQAHDLIQSGTSVGKIVINTGEGTKKQ